MPKLEIQTCDVCMYYKRIHVLHQNGICPIVEKYFDEKFKMRSMR